MINDCEFYDLEDEDMKKAWNMMMNMPLSILKLLNKKAKRDMKKMKEGSTGTYYMSRDVLLLRK